MSVPTLSVVVPAYNEAKVIAETLECLLDQIDRIDEIIVVDNNSTDVTAEIVASMLPRSPKLRMIQEPVQGLIAARDAGVETATSEIIARIDADTLVHVGWAAAITDFFADCPDDVGAITGTLVPYDTPRSFRDMLVNSQDMEIEKKLAQSEDPRAVYGIEAVCGPNVAFRRQAWVRVQDTLTPRTDVYEGLDLALCLREVGYRFAWVVDMRADVSGRRLLTSRKSYWEYTALFPRTWRLHGSNQRARKGLVEMWANRTMYLVYWLPLRAYDAEVGGYALKNVFASRDERVIPTQSRRLGAREGD